jgi:glycosyltransferase involved in cell wall biosynthesis
MTARLKVNVVGRIDGHTGIARHTRAFLLAWKDAFETSYIDTRPESSDLTRLPPGVAVAAPGEVDLRHANVSVFTDVTANAADDFNWTKVPVTRLKYVFSVFDSTRVPVQWADIINNHFDALFVPSRFLVESFRASRVQKPIFHLPLALDLQPWLDAPRPGLARGEPFRFGFIGSREARKNVDRLVRCFVETFGADPGVELLVHCALDFYGDRGYFSRMRARYGNVHFTHGTLDDSAYRDLIDRIDCLVSLSMGEGYSIVPREFLAAGKPVALSNCFAHAEILAGLATHGDGLGFAIEADVPVPAWYGHIYGGRHFGVQFDTYPPSACAVMADIYDQRASLFSAGRVDARRAWAAQFDHAALGPLYRSIVAPAMCRRSIGDALEYGGISTADANLMSRLAGGSRALSVVENLREQPVKYVVIANDGGFFSVFNRMVSYIAWATTEHPDSVVLPDWRIAAMQRHWKTETFTSFCYGTPQDGNLWLKLFEPLPYRQYNEADYNDESVLYAGAELKDDFNEGNEPWLTYTHAYKLYRSTGFRRWRQWYHAHLASHVRLRPHLQARVDAFYDQHLRGYTVISAHIRHPSHGIEQPGARMPTVDLYCEKISSLMGEIGLTPASTRLFLATDQDSVVEQVAAAFGDMVVYSPGVERTTREHDRRFSGLSEAERMREGHQIQHLKASDPSKWGLRMAEEVIVDTYLLARGDYFIHVTSNIATAVSFINPRIRMIYCE